MSERFSYDREEMLAQQRQLMAQRIVENVTLLDATGTTGVDDNFPVGAFEIREALRDKETVAFYEGQGLTFDQAVEYGVAEREDEISQSVDSLSRTFTLLNIMDELDGPDESSR